MLPDDLAIKVADNKKLKIPAKKPDEKRILSVDLALMASKKTKNDASAIFINQLVPTKTGRYINNIVYTESSEGQHTADQALRVRKLYDMYNCDYLVIDGRGGQYALLSWKQMGNKVRKISGTLRREPEWKARPKRRVTCNAYELILLLETIMLARGRTA